MAKSACFPLTTSTGDRQKFRSNRRKRKGFMGKTKTEILEEQNQSIDTGDSRDTAVAESQREKLGSQEQPHLATVTSADSQDMLSISQTKLMNSSFFSDSPRVFTMPYAEKIGLKKEDGKERATGNCIIDKELLINCFNKAEVCRQCRSMKSSFSLKK